MRLTDSILEWGKHTADFYHDLATKIGIEKVPAFYTQSDLTKITQPPTLMIAGINPGSEGSYEQQIKNPNWQLDDIGRMDGVHLVKGNFCLKGDGTAHTVWDDHTHWHYWYGLKRYFSRTDYKYILDDESQFVLTNASFFTTPKANELPDNLLTATIPQTLQLIELLQPQLVVFLSGKKCFQRLDKIKEKVGFRFRYAEILPNIYIGELNDKVCLGVPHPTYRSSHEMEMIIQGISLLYKENIDTVNHHKIQEQFQHLGNIAPLSKARTKQQPSFYQQILADVIADSRFHFKVFNEKQYRYEFNEDLFISLSPANHGKIAIRHKNYQQKYSETQATYAYQSEYKTILSQYNYDVSTEVWLGTKTLKSYGISPQEIIDHIFQELDNILIQFRNMRME